jgi:hypothetical protein
LNPEGFTPNACGWFVALTDTSDLQAENETLRKALQRVRDLAAGVSTGDVGASWRALGSLGAVCERALGDEHQGGKKAATS